MSQFSVLCELDGSLSLEGPVASLGDDYYIDERSQNLTGAREEGRSASETASASRRSSDCRQSLWILLGGGRSVQRLSVGAGCWGWVLSVGAESVV